ncbi:DEAD/DEAH box helicase family protein, partial [Paeniroseomonas aquatica]
MVRAIAAGEAAGVRDILAAVTPGGGKSLLPVLAAQALIAAGLCERICWVVPRDSLRLQAEEVFADPAWRQALGHDLSVRAADNTPGDPCRGLAGYVTTYQGIAAAPDLHLAAIRRHRYLLVVDEVHHLPGLNEADAAGGRDVARMSPRPGRRRSSRCWRCRQCGCYSPARWSGRMGGESSGCPIGVASVVGRRSTWQHRAGRWSATAGPG